MIIRKEKLNSTLLWSRFFIQFVKRQMVELYMELKMASEQEEVFRTGFQLWGGMVDQLVELLPRRLLVQIPGFELATFSQRYQLRHCAASGGQIHNISL